MAKAKLGGAVEQVPALVGSGAFGSQGIYAVGGMSSGGWKVRLQHLSNETSGDMPDADRTRVDHDRDRTFFQPPSECGLSIQNLLNSLDLDEMISAGY